MAVVALYTWKHGDRNTIRIARCMIETVTPRSGRLGRGRSLTLLGPLPGRTS
ncbi:hypothetical protein F2Q69_00058221 [Brassica cretica]|uniref:Uncharacterized protein n=1 Tax=Brassica cretica TaxID=69181 RepID=A0A8S9RB22_BRACR|nr:hypothetical protein F2Q69_00058221 [Brassica cretica]